jgi:hypothetical protein
MKKLMHLCAAVVFTLVLTTATLGGDISTGGKTEPPPPPPASSAVTSEEIQTEQDIQDPEAMSDSVTDLALNLLYIMLTVF